MSNIAVKKGIFITIYGINNIGKSTQAKLLVERLEKAGHKAKYLKYPVYELEPTGPFLYKTLRDPNGQKILEDELQLWFILNRYQFQPELKRLLDEGYVVVAEDYVGTGVAWGTAKGLDREWLEETNKFLLKEDFAILMEGQRKISSKEEGHVHEQNEPLLMKCTEVLAKLAEKYGWKRLQVQEKKEDTAESLWRLVAIFLKDS